MFINYFKISWRNMVRNRAFSVIHIVGLALGLATCLLISLYVLDELSYDRYNEKADRIVRVVFKGSTMGGKFNEAHVMPPTAQTLKATFPEIAETARIRDGWTPRIIVGEKLFHEERLVFADPSLFRVFTLPFLYGNPQTALTAPNTVVITQTTAKKYFGSDAAMGRLITLKGSKENFKITGVIADIPADSHFHFDLAAAMSSLPESRSNSWLSSEFFTYLLLQEGYDYRKLEAQLPQIVEKHIGPQFQQSMGMSLAQFRKKGNDIGLYLQPLTDIHLHSDFAYDLGMNGDVSYVYIFSAVAVFMLLIACINFMNLSTAGASRRAREVGIRKVLGSERSALTYQFLAESLLFTAIALIFAVGLVYLLLPAFNQLAGKALTLNPLVHVWLLPGLLLFGLLVGLLAGSYPAFFLSSFKPVAVLKGSANLFRLASGHTSIRLRSALVIFQFFISITMMIGTTVVYRQLHYIQHKKLGYNKNQVLILSETWALGNNQEIFRKQLLQDPGIERVTSSSYLPAGPSGNNNFIVSPENNSTQLVKTLRYDIDEQYIPTLGMELVAGRNFSKDLASDSSAVILNETAARTLGWNDRAIGHTISRGDESGKKAMYHVIGVVRDFHFRSLHEPIAPLVMALGNNQGTTIVRIRTTDIPALLIRIHKLWTGHRAELPFTYAFLNDRFNQTYRSEQKTGRILGIFAGLTIFVASLGLFGLATFTAQQRTREIGVRKVLGASVSSIVALLSGEFLKLVLIAILVASPVAWWVMHRWLQDFAYRIDLQGWMFILAGCAAILIAMITISFQAIKAAVVNPVKSLRTE